MSRKFVKSICLIAISLVFCNITFAKNFDEKSPVGLWTTISDDDNKPRSMVQIKLNKGNLEGIIMKVYSKPDDHALCIHCQGNLKNKPIVGMRFMWGLKPSGELEWSGGKILVPKNGKTYKCKIALDKSGKKLSVRGYFGISLFGRTQTWIRRSSQ